MVCTQSSQSPIRASLVEVSNCFEALEIIFLFIISRLGSNNYDTVLALYLACDYRKAWKLI